MAENDYASLIDAIDARRRRRLWARANGGLWLAVVIAVFAAAVWIGVPHVSRDLADVRSVSAAGPAAQPAAPTSAILTARVTRIVDGDGLVLKSGEEIRLGDFNAPERGQPGGSEAKAALSDIAYGETVDCTPCEGARRAGQCTSYDRIIATCRLNGRRLGDLMRARGVREGGR